MDRLEIRSKFQSKVTPFTLEKYDITLNLRGLTAMARAELGDKYSAIEKDKSGDNPAVTAVKEIQARVVSQGLVDEKGNRLYRDDELEAIATEFPGDALDAVAKEIMRLSSLTADRVEDIKKKSETAQSSGSSEESLALLTDQTSTNSRPN
jgi:hypothetical protein